MMPPEDCNPDIVKKILGLFSRICCSYQQISYNLCVKAFCFSVKIAVITSAYYLIINHEAICNLQFKVFMVFEGYLKHSHPLHKNIFLDTAGKKILLIEKLNLDRKQKQHR